MHSQLTILPLCVLLGAFPSFRPRKDGYVQLAFLIEVQGLDPPIAPFAAVLKNSSFHTLLHQWRKSPIIL